MSDAVFISGLWPSKDANGFQGFRDELHTLNLIQSSELRAYDDKNSITLIPKIVMAHSLGANEALRYASIFELDALILIEPVRYWWSQKKWQVPTTVKKTLCFLRDGWRLPPSVPVEKKQDNIYIPGLDHANAPRDQNIQADIIRLLSELYPQA